MYSTTGFSASPSAPCICSRRAAAPGERFLSYSGQFLEPAAAIWVILLVSFACHFWVSVLSLACKISCGDFGEFLDLEARIGFTLVLVLFSISLLDLFGLVFEFFVGKKYTSFFSWASSCLLLDFKQRGTLAFSGY